MSVASVDSVVYNKTFLLSPSQETFITFLRTKMIFTLRLRGEGDEIQAVHIKSTEIEERFFPFPRFKRKEQIKILVDAGELRVTEKDKKFYYEALKPGKIDFSLLIVKPLPNDPIYTIMLNNIKTVSLPKDAASTEYFDLFLRYKNERPELFFKVDAFAKRVHTPISNFHRTHRPFILINDEKTTSLDVATMQPLLLGKILTKYVVNNEYSRWINEGEDIYIKLQNKAKLKTRDEAKKKFFEILFSKPTQELAKLFGSADWIEWINNYKSIEEPLNPHGKIKRHSNLAWLLQSTEVKIMEKIWLRLIQNDIIFLPVHDEIIIPISKAEIAKSIMTEVLSKEFEYFKISCDNKVLFKPTLATLPTPIKNENVISAVETKIVEIKKSVDTFLPTLNRSWEIPNFEGLLIPDELIISKCETIINVKQCIKSHMDMVVDNIGKTTFYPYLHRLKIIHGLIVNAPLK